MRLIGNNSGDDPQRVHRSKGRKWTGLCIVMFLAVTVGNLHAQSAPAVPDNLKAPSDERLLLKGHATGVQIYTCQAVPNGNSQFAWQLSGPDARLVDDSGKEVARHFAGPSWQSPDGSVVKGKVVSQDAVDPDSIAWLMLTAAGHSGTGIMADVRTIQRLNTRGGKAPVSGCDSQHQGAQARVDYTADYYFYALSH